MFLPTIDDTLITPLLDANRNAVLAAVEEAYRLYAAGNAIEAVPSYLRFPHDPAARIIAKPAALYGPAPIAGVKWISSFPSNARSSLPRASGVLVLNDITNGQPRCCIEAAAISAHRTAASAVLALGRLHDRAALDRGVTLVGAGPIARHVADYLIAEGWVGRRWTIADPDSDRAESLKSVLEAALPGGSLVCTADGADAVRTADIIVFATSAGHPHLDGEDLFDEGQTVLHLSLRDLGPAAIRSASNYTDCPAVAFTNATSLQLAEEAAGGRDFLIGGIGAVLEGHRPQGRPVIFSPFGLAVLDLAVASWVEANLRSPSLVRNSSELGCEARD